MSVVDTSTDSMTEHLRHGPSSPSLAVQQGEELRAIVLGALKVTSCLLHVLQAMWTYTLYCFCSIVWGSCVW